MRCAYRLAWASADSAHISRTAHTVACAAALSRDSAAADLLGTLGTALPPAAPESSDSARRGLADDVGSFRLIRIINADVTAETLRVSAIAASPRGHFVIGTQTGVLRRYRLRSSALEHAAPQRRSTPVGTPPADASAVHVAEWSSPTHGSVRALRYAGGDADDGVLLCICAGDVHAFAGALVPVPPPPIDSVHVAQLLAADSGRPRGTRTDTSQHFALARHPQLARARAEGRALVAIAVGAPRGRPPVRLRVYALADTNAGGIVDAEAGAGADGVSGTSTAPPLFSSVRELVLPSAITQMEWCGHYLCVAHRTEYVLISVVTGSVRELFSFSADFGAPLLARLSRSELLVAQAYLRVGLV